MAGISLDVALASSVMFMESKYSANFVSFSPVPSGWFLLISSLKKLEDATDSGTRELERDLEIDSDGALEIEIEFDRDLDMELDRDREIEAETQYCINIHIILTLIRYQLY
jgi:hypothetical protein